jgi:hypothetical protein
MGLDAERGDDFADLPQASSGARVACWRSGGERAMHGEGRRVDDGAVADASRCACSSWCSERAACATS